MPAPSKETLLKIAAENPDLVDLIKPMLKEGAVKDRLADVEFELILITDLVRAIKQRSNEENEPDLNWMTQQVETQVKDMKESLQKIMKSLR